MKIVPITKHYFYLIKLNRLTTRKILLKYVYVVRKTFRILILHEDFK